MQSSDVSGSVDLERERKALLAMHAQDRRAHMTTDAQLILAYAADEFIYVGAGKITRMTRDEVAGDFAEMFAGATYQEWDDMEPPIVSISADASMAWMIVRTRVRRTHREADGQEQRRQFVYAGITTYEKRDGTWVRVANVSTFERQAAGE
ncbi:MAG TPA: DUF4440 domain-containing protein [Ktedonobacterales bacterium]|jgi:hypothetical protein|nr:DUF4440 domain-containing protein [Ktedonobacterales bacterium]